MRSAVLYALAAFWSVSGLCAQDPPPSKPVAEADPAKMATPKEAAIPKTAAPVDAKTYLMGAEDVIMISVYRSPEFSGAHMIRPDGIVSINLVGDVKAAGLSPEQLTAEIRERLKKYLVDPEVTVSVTQVNSKKYFIVGEVLKPGENRLVVPTTVLEALVNAGGFKDFAKTKKITIKRGTESLKFNYNDVINGKHLEQNVQLQPHDIIVVK